MNSVILIGRLTKHPEPRVMDSGVEQSKFILAVNREMSKEKKQEAEAKGYPTADFIRIVAWGKTAEVCNKYLSKGSQVAIVGRVQIGSYKDKDEKMVYTTDIFAEKVEFLESRKQQTEIKPTYEEVGKEKRMGFIDKEDSFEIYNGDIPF